MEEYKKEPNTENAGKETSVKEKNLSAGEEEKKAETQNLVSEDGAKKENFAEAQDIAPEDSKDAEKKEDSASKEEEKSIDKVEEKQDENVGKEEESAQPAAEKIAENIKSEKIYSNVVAGANVKIHQKIKEKKGKEEKERIQIFDGIVLARKGGSSAGATITVQKICKGGFEVKKIFPLHLPTISKIEVGRQAKVRKAKLSFLKRTYKKKLKY
ncbi:MAG: 50S ribosomal protein L19 [bacterium]